MRMSQGKKDLTGPSGRERVVRLIEALHLSLIHISEPTRPYSISYAVFCLKKKNNNKRIIDITHKLKMRQRTLTNISNTQPNNI